MFPLYEILGPNGKELTGLEYRWGNMERVGYPLSINRDISITEPYTIIWEYESIYSMLSTYAAFERCQAPTCMYMDETDWIFYFYRKSESDPIGIKITLTVFYGNKKSDLYID